MKKKYLEVLYFATTNEQLENEEFYRNPILLELYPSEMGYKEKTRKIGYLIGYCIKKGWLRTVSAIPPAIYAITAAGRVQLRLHKYSVKLLTAKDAPERRDTLEEYIEEEKPKAEPPADLPSVVGIFNGASLASVKVSIKGCPVELEAKGSIIGYLLANDLLRRRVRMWLIGNEIVWVEEHEYER